MRVSGENKPSANKPIENKMPLGNKPVENKMPVANNPIENKMAFENKMAAATTPNVIFQADMEWVEFVKKTHYKMAEICGLCMHKRVRCHTIDGHVHEGVLVGHDGCILHLMIPPSENAVRFFGPWAAGTILPLVLFNLLTITLLI